MGFPEFVTDGCAPVVKAGGKSLGKLKLLWSELVDPMQRWHPQQLAKAQYHWRGFTIYFGRTKGLAFAEAVVGRRRAILSFYDKAALFADHPAWRNYERMQTTYNAAFRRRTLATEQSVIAAHGLQPFGWGTEVIKYDEDSPEGLLGRTF